MVNKAKRNAIRESQEKAPLYAVMRQFIGVQNKSPRQSIADNEFANLINAMPVGDGNLAGINGHSANLYSPTASTWVNCVPVVRNNVQKMLLFRADGGLEEATMNSSGGIASHVVVKAAGTLSGSATLNGRTVFSAACDWQNNLTLIVDPTKGYFTWDGTTWTAVDAALLGHTIAVFYGRVVIGYGNKYTLLGTTGPTDENAANGFNTYRLGVSALKGDIVKIKSSTSYLFIFTSDGIGIINTIQFINSLNYFQLQPISIGVGAFPQSDVLDYNGILMFADISGIYLINQSTAQFIGDDISGTWPGYNLLYGNGVSSARVTLNGRRVPMFLVGSSGSALLVTNIDGKWWFATDNGIGIVQIFESDPATGGSFMYAITSGGFYQLFNTPSATLPVTIETKLFDMGNALLNKDVVRVGVEGMFPNATSINGTADTEAGSVNFTTHPMTASGSLQQLDSDASNSGKYMGETLTFTSTGAWYISALLFEYDMGTPW